MNSDDEANRKVPLTVHMPNHAFKALERLATSQGVRVEELAAAELHGVLDRDFGYQPTHIDREAGSWIHRNLFPAPDYQFSAAPFEAGERLYWTAVDDPVLKGIVDGVGQPAPWKYEQLLHAVKDVTESAAAQAFYVALHDNMVADTRWVRTHAWTGWWTPLYAIELEPGAAEGGASYVGILSEKRDWLLMHDYSPCNDLTISLHASAHLCKRLLALLERARR